MKLQIYSVYDAATGAFMQPFFARARGEAIRSFIDASADEKHQFNRHASDYTLFHIGEFDDANASFGIPEVPEKIVSALECIASSSN